MDRIHSIFNWYGRRHVVYQVHPARCFFGFVVFAIFLSVAACSIPNLESSSCTDSRNAVREFYSFHIGNSMSFTADDLKLREKFLTPEFVERLRSSKEGTDPFTTGTTDFPKAFRVGECKDISPNRTAIQVLLLWRDDTRTEERKIGVEAEKRGENWLIDKVFIN